MKPTSRTTQIEDLIEELIALRLAQVADLREYAKAVAVEEGTIQLERSIRRREAQGTELYRLLELAILPGPAAKS